MERGGGNCEYWPRHSVASFLTCEKTEKEGERSRREVERRTALQRKREKVRKRKGGGRREKR